MLDAIVVDHEHRTISPKHDAADEFFGVAWGTNGTAAECRRSIVTPSGYRWVRSDGRLPLHLEWYR